MKILKLFIKGFLALAAFGFVLQILGLAPKTETPETPKVTVQSSTTETKEETSESTEVTEPSSEKATYDVAEMNVKITDSFNEAIQFNQDGHDGYEWTSSIYEIKLKDNGAINATVNEHFSTLSDTKKTEVLNSVSRMVNMVVFLETEKNKSYFITAYDQAGNKVAQSHMTNVLKYNFE
ncbi:MULTISPECIES: hypothetical protein [unclassified Streptococcus]|uniref:hypothetical protein n=2 Tax=Streptococcus TaxID=1301 RepID=UPI001072E462|nr:MULTISPECIES: hypothetical protein [unclassified Streptococcus]MBF0788151.1 hypothetical protein [Streptococcus sp. 19428wC2_LYSM12]MCQ9211878.1 hypothetical protein [Streptococcus sp. B01]MCQ9213000.1 hypothetical protein [Streptococcus sp. O1]TFV04788.1 hypothetical protein E4T79_09700 [Streptococcus sp. LYSM12]